MSDAQVARLAQDVGKTPCKEMRTKGTCSWKVGRAQLVQELYAVLIQSSPNRLSTERSACTASEFNPTASSPQSPAEKLTRGPLSAATCTVSTSRTSKYSFRQELLSSGIVV